MDAAGRGAATGKGRALVDTWILAGQSNMEGCGLLAEAVDPVDERVEHLTSAGDWAVAAHPLHRLWESYTPVHAQLMRAGIPDETRDDAELARAARDESPIGAGLGVAFGQAMAELTGRRIGLVPAAHGGTSLEQWSPGHGGAPDDSTATLYGAMLDRARRALGRPGAVLRGLLWYQGESDASPSRSRDYGERLEAWIARVRRDLGEPELPVLVVQLGRFARPLDTGDNTERSWDAVREAQRTLPRRVPATGLATAVDLPLTDSIHVDARGLARLGRRLARLAHTRSTGPDVTRVALHGRDPHGLCTLRVSCSDVTGGWAPAARLPGFVLCEADGRPIARLRVVDARPPADDPTAIEIVTTAVEAHELEGAFLSHGLGYDPVCLAVDGADLALPAFAPQPIALEGAASAP